ncbi:MAG: helix-turn-helix domain-containing protein [Marinilabiliaceae bacterium]|nr:helix-turn-helix domain-containing protein [Marinilabiliaceae bacterium]
MSKTVLIVDEYLYGKLIGKIDRLNEKIDKIILAEKQSGLKNKWYVTDEVCSILNISKRTLQKMRDSGAIEFTKTGKKCYYKASSVEAFLENHSS